MRKFSLTAAQKGLDIVTRDGRPARYVCVLSRQQPAPLVVEVFQYTEEELDKTTSRLVPAAAQSVLRKKIIDDNGNWHMENFTEDGRYLGAVDSEMDLFIKTL